MTMRVRRVPPPPRIEQPAPDLPKKTGFGIRWIISGRVELHYDFQAWTRPDALERALERGIWL